VPRGGRAAPPDVGHSHGDENGRVELHGDRRTEHAEAETVALVDERGECARDEHRRPEIEAGEDDRAEEEREAGDQREHPDGTGPGGPQSVEGDAGEQDHRRPACGHQPLEGIAITRLVVAGQRRQHEHRKRARRVLGTYVAVGTAPSSIALP
jgi:hypothetical protein